MLRRTLVLPLAFLAAYAAAGCGGAPMAKVKGMVVENGQSKSFPATSWSVEMSPISASGDTDKMKSFTAMVNPDGSFELQASGGELPAGPYLFTVRGPQKKTGGALPAAGATPSPSGAKRELKSGTNEITLDLAKPNE